MSTVDYRLTDFVLFTACRCITTDPGDVKQSIHLQCRIYMYLSIGLILARLLGSMSCPADSDRENRKNGTTLVGVGSYFLMPSKNFVGATRPTRLCATVVP